MLPDGTPGPLCIIGSLLPDLDAGPDTTIANPFKIKILPPPRAGSGIAHPTAVQTSQAGPPVAGAVPALVVVVFRARSLAPGPGGRVERGLVRPLLVVLVGFIG